MSMIVKVTTEELKKASGEIKTQLDKVRTEFSEIENVMSKTSVYWQSEAADVHRNRFNDKKEDIREAIARLNEQIDDLEKMAGIYEAAERANISTAASLPSDVIS